MINGQTDPGLEIAQPTNGHASGQFSEPSIPAWWSVIERYSRLLVAVVNLQNHRIEWTSDRFRKLVGMVDAPPTLGDTVLQRLDPEDQRWVRERIRRHVLQAILSAHYERTDLIPSRWLHEPLILSVKPLEGDRARFVEFNISSDHIRILSLDPAIEKALADCWSGTPDPPMVMQQLNDQDAPLQRVWQLL
ncbi:MAG: GAF domain-containing protein, partial [Cyanobacteria bacterium J06639_14]